MARGSTLLQLLDIVRAEARLSQNPAHNAQVRDATISKLQREQTRLWEEYDWPHMRAERLIATANGQRFYSPPADLAIDRIETVEYKTDGDWVPIYSGIGAEQYALHDSALDERSNPVSRWRIWEGEQIEIWPIPDEDAVPATQEGYLKIIGIKNLPPLVADDDTAALDDYVICMYVAAEILAASGSKDANLKLEMANKRLSKIVGNLNTMKSFRMFEKRKQGPVRGIITRYKAP